MPRPAIRSFDELYQQIRRLPEHLTGEILEPGVIRTMSRPGGPHRYAARRVLRSLGSFDIDEGGQGWWFEVEAEVRLLVERLVVPDLAGWRSSEIPAFVHQNPIPVVPDWACEILSPSTARDDRALKLPIYSRAGLNWVWLVDPDLRLVEVYELGGGRIVLAATARDDDQLALPPFDSPLALGRWWLPPPAVPST